METVAIILTVLAAAVALEWLMRNLLALSVWRKTFHLTPEWQIPPGPLPTLSVVVAAKDEEHNIDACVTTLLEQDYPDFELIVVDDRSRDRTAEIIDGYAATDPRVKALHVESLPEGWCGKNHAMSKGLAVARGEWILMTDADCSQLSPRSLSLSVAYARECGTDLLSLLPALELHSFWERMLQPVCAGVLMIWFRPARVNDPARREAYANGMFMLMRRQAYDAIGGHEAIKGSLIEDMDMADRIKKSGLRLCMSPSEGLFSVRMYTTFRQILRGWQRIFFGAFRSLPRLVAALVMLLGKGLTCYIAAALGWWLYAVSPSDAYLALAVVGTIGTALETVMLCRYNQHTGSRWIYGLAYPFNCVIVGYMLVRALLTHRRGARLIWRDTSYLASGSGV